MNLLQAVWSWCVGSLKESAGCKLRMWKGSCFHSEAVDPYVSVIESKSRSEWITHQCRWHHQNQLGNHLSSHIGKSQQCLCTRMSTQAAHCKYSCGWRSHIHRGLLWTQTSKLVKVIERLLLLQVSVHPMDTYTSIMVLRYRYQHTCARDAVRTNSESRWTPALIWSDSVGTSCCATT